MVAATMPPASPPPPQPPLSKWAALGIGALGGIVGLLVSLGVLRQPDPNCPPINVEVVQPPPPAVVNEAPRKRVVVDAGPRLPSN